METIYIGVPYSCGVKTKDGTVFADTPIAALYNRPSRKCYEAEGALRQDGGYDFEFPAELTGQMLPGMYNVEIYNNDKSVLYKRIENYAKAMSVVASPDSIIVEQPSQS